MSYFSGDFLKISSSDAVPVTKYSILMSGYLSKKLLIIGAKNEVSVLDKMLKAQENIVIDAISVGASDFLQKPFTKETLRNSIEKVISNIEEA